MPARAQAVAAARTRSAKYETQVDDGAVHFGLRTVFAGTFRSIVEMSETDESRIGRVVADILRGAVGSHSLPAQLEASTPLLGVLPELDSMALVSILAEIEAHFDCRIPDDDVNAEVFATFGSLCMFVGRCMNR